MNDFHNDPYSQRNQRGSDPNAKFNQNNFLNDDFLFDQGLENYRSDIENPQYRYGPEYNNKAHEKADLLSSQIKFEPKFFDSDLTQKKYRGTNLVLSVKSQLPQILLTSSLQKKIQKNLSQSNKKDSLIFASSQTDDNESNKKFIIDEISYSLEESEENYYDVNKYPLLLVTSPLPDAAYEESLELESEMEIIEEFCKKCRMGAFALLSQESLFNQKNTDFSAPFQDTDHGALTSSDLVYLNMFRIFSFLFKTKISNTSRYIAQRLLYFPNVSFKIASIQQPFKLVATPLNNLVTKRSKGENGKKPNVKFGFVSLDANQRMLFFMTSDPLAAQIPLIGLWVYGINPHLEKPDDESQDKNVLQGILFEYINSTLKNRYSFDKIRKTFLLAVFSPEEGAKYYEVEFGEKLSNDENENRWVMLKTSRETSSINEALDFLQRGFMLSNENITKDLASVKKSLLDNAQSNFKDNYSSAKRNQSNDSLSNYLSGNARQQQQQQETYFDATEEEADNFDITPHQLPQKPQSPPQMETHPLPLLNQSGTSLRTATFIGGNEDTFAQDSSRNAIPFFPDPGNSKRQYSPKEKEKLSPFAEQFIAHQDQQLKFLQSQILALQTALLNGQMNSNQGLLPRLAGNGGAANNNGFPIDMNHPDTGRFGSNNRPIVFPETKQTVDRGCDPITEEWLMSQNYYTMNEPPRNSYHHQMHYQAPRTMMRNEQPPAFMEMNNRNNNNNNYQMQMNMMNGYQPERNFNPYENEVRSSYRSQRNYEEYENQNPLQTEMGNSQRMENSEDYDQREYQSSAYSSNRYNEPAPIVVEKRYEEPKFSNEEFRYQNTRPAETRLEDDGRRLFKDITNDSRNERVQQQENNYESVDLKAGRESSHKSSATKENEPVKEPIVTKAFVEEQKPVVEIEKPVIQREEPKKPSVILAPLEEKETSIQIPKTRFGKNPLANLDSDDDDDEFFKGMKNKYLLGK